jgi:hypothetical protein
MRVKKELAVLLAILFFAKSFYPRNFIYKLMLTKLFEQKKKPVAESGLSIALKKHQENPAAAASVPSVSVEKTPNNEELAEDFAGFSVGSPTAYIRSISPVVSAIQKGGRG